MLAAIRERCDRLGVELTLVPHVEFKKLSGDPRAAVRSAEFTFYANVTLTCGVVY